MDIVEVPLDAPTEESPSAPAAPAPAAPAAKRGRGRPKGAPNKPKPRAPREPTPEPPEPAPRSPPKIKAKAPAKRKPVEENLSKKKRIVHESSESEDAPDARKTTREIAGEVLELLSLQRANQRAQRRDRYAAWFQ
jgi:hypothetical protein